MEFEITSFRAILVGIDQNIYNLGTGFAVFVSNSITSAFYLFFIMFLFYSSSSVNACIQPTL